ncbi:hypothetical protein TNCV_4600811 [Trichonephila clavipes]|nr:hypothetical protein TNCV_4600811 [Trichonephila clavipes]
MKPATLIPERKTLKTRHSCFKAARRCCSSKRRMRNNRIVGVCHLHQTSIRTFRNRRHCFSLFGKREPVHPIRYDHPVSGLKEAEGHEIVIYNFRLLWLERILAFISLSSL